ncbi:hypothetical protein INS49_009084 [Diaporthe citri]|uniref:uncharacterized protein n=1 Tax=Diaporthe citri TaxID=83186 RepID=UPI001C8187FE|nr:uncharacterized protein INS49_009084 [Diaporthe citri]KAG6363981.1 hypothetical protein INS49_009084 [Diaporthe citri]
MASNQDSFRYNSTLKGRQIRVMYVECHSGLNLLTSPLSVRLVEENLDTAEFDALSYVWGDQATRMHINCNGKSATIGQSLHAALIEYRLRLRLGRGRDGDQIRGLWADAICINQNNEVEKTEQVRMMRDIYKAARFTIIWLGPLEDGDVQAIQLTQLAYRRCSEHLRFELKGTRQDYRFFKATRRGLPEPFYPEGFVGMEFDPTWKTLFKILHHPWFSRIWIVQELLVSEYAEMWRGRESIEVDALLWMADQIATHTDLKLAMELQYPNERLFFADVIALCYYQFNENSPPPLWANMMITRGMKATEDLDRFFALAGISQEVPDGFINYSRRIEIVASQVGLMALLGSPENPTMDGLDQLADFPSRGVQNRGIQLQTWIPDFFSAPPPPLEMSLLYSTSKLRSKNPEFPLPEFQITTDPEAPSPSPRPLTVSEFPYLFFKAPELLVKATIFGRIKDTVAPTLLGTLNGNKRGSDDLEQYYRHSINMLRFITTTRLLGDPSLSVGDDVMSGDKFETFWRTMVYNRTGDSFVEEVIPDSTIGISFGYWYMFWRLYQTRRWEQDADLFFAQLDLLQGLKDPFISIFDQAYGYRSFFVTEGDRIGWAPPAARPGDAIAMFQGNRIPFVARSVGDSGPWEYVGGCYVHGCMDGEIWQLDKAIWDFMTFV